jgi:hypothetical protein
MDMLEVRKEFSGKEKATGTSVGIGIIIGSVIGDRGVDR